MSTQNLIITYATSKIRVAASVVAGLFTASLQAIDATGAAVGNPVVTTSDVPTVTVVGVVDGDYLVTHSRPDQTGAPIGKAIVEPITIANGGVVVDQLLDGIVSASYALVAVAEAPAPTGDAPAASDAPAAA